MTATSTPSNPRLDKPSYRSRFGVELDFGRLDADPGKAIIDQIRDAVVQHGFAVFRDQRFVDPALLTFGRQFGQIEERVIKYSTVGPSQSQDATPWHHHSSCRGKLEDWIVYYTPAVPDAGGSIEFFDAAQWFAMLSTADQQWARQQRVRHDFTSVAHAGIPPLADPPWHPLVTARQLMGGMQEALYWGAHAVELEGDHVAMSAPLERMHEAAKNPALYRAHDARAHDLIVWDMRMVAHRSVPWRDASLRVIHEVIIRELA